MQKKKIVSAERRNDDLFDVPDSISVSRGDIGFWFSGF
jgi:hypothetical protein